jgi:hypothetical protein
VLSEEAILTNFIVFGLTRSRLEPTIYSIGSEQANHYTTDAVDQVSNNSAIFMRRTNFPTFYLVILEWDYWWQYNTF